MLTSLLHIAAALAVVASSAFAQLQFNELVKRYLPLEYDGTSAVALGDVDGDGDLDVVFGNSSQQDWIYLNDGSGTFTDATAARMPLDNDDTVGVALGDVDGDGDLDMVFANGYFQQNRLYLNNGSGTFTDVTAARMPFDKDLTSAVVLGDVDGDGDLDMVFANGVLTPIGKKNRLYLNDGSGTFTDATAARMPIDNGNSRGVVLGDVDGDGDLDLVFATFLGQNRLYVNDGSGTFTDATAARMPTDNEDTQGVALGDVDGDGDLDLVFAVDFQQDRLYLNDGTGIFTDTTAARMPTDSARTYAVALADVDGDGDLDLVFATFLGQNRLYMNDGTGTFADTTTARMPTDSDRTWAVAPGDVDGDGDLDFVFATTFFPNHLYMNDGSGTFTGDPAPRMPIDYDSTGAVALGDVDSDGDLDMVIGNDLQQNRLYLNDGTGTFADATAARMPIDNDYTYVVLLGDVDGDGDLDLVFGNWFYQNRLLLNDGTGTFTDATAARMPLGSDDTRAVALGDVDGDGDLDMVVANDFQQNRLYLNDGTGTFTNVSAARMPFDYHNTYAVALGDMDGDGDLDLVFGNSFQQDRLYLNDGTGTFTDATPAHMPLGSDDTRAVALGDVDGDGDLDMVLANSGQSRLYLNDGTGTFTDATAARMPTRNDNTLSVTLGDVDGDGDLDLVFAVDFQQDRLYMNDGTGVFSDATAARMRTDSERTYAAALGDVDDDGDLDLVFASGWGKPNRLYFNLLRHLDSPVPLVTIGGRYQLDVYSRYDQAGSVTALPLISVGQASIPTIFGTLGLNPGLMVGLPILAIPKPSGVTSIILPVPNSPSLVGGMVYAQALVGTISPTALRFTNVTTDMIQ